MGKDSYVFMFANIFRRATLKVAARAGLIGAPPAKPNQPYPAVMSCTTIVSI